jgi:hypothetical protein
MLDGDGVERFERLNHTKRGSVLLYDTEPSRPVRRVRGFEYASVDLTLYKFAYVLVNPGRYGYVSYDPRLMSDRRDFDRREEVFFKMSAFRVAPSEAILVNHHELVHKVSFARPKKVAGVCVVNILLSLESVASVRAKGSWMLR